MRTQIAGITLATAMIGAGLLVMRSRPRGEVNLRAASQALADLSRDADQLVLKTTRVSDAEEIAEGERIASHITAPVATDAVMAACVENVGRRVAARAARKGLPYSFVVLADDHANAFALPGGRVYVLVGLVRSVEAEDELAAVLGHEISHVDLRHAVERRQLELRAARYRIRPAGGTLDILRLPWAAGYSQDQEIDADVNGLRLAAEAGYDPRKSAEWMSRQAGTARRTAEQRHRNPASEAAGATVEAVHNHWATHPGNEERAVRMRAAAARLAHTGPATASCPVELWHAHRDWQYD